MASFLAVAFFISALCIRRIRQFAKGRHRIGQPSRGLTAGGLLRSLFIFTLCSIPAALVVCGWPQIASTLTQNGLGEPMFLIEGISIWPATALRAGGAFLSLFLIWRALRSLEQNRRRTFAEMRLPNFENDHVDKGLARLSRNRSISSIMQNPYIFCDKANNSYPCYPITRFLFHAYYRSLPKHRLYRSIAATLLFIFTVGLFTGIFGLPDQPGRGALAGTLYRTTTIVDVAISATLAFLVIDATLLTRSFITQLARVRSHWPRQTVEYSSKQMHVNPSILGDWIDMHFIAKRTECITNLIYLPFIAIAFVILTRNTMFTNFTLSTALTIAWLTVGAIIVGSAMALRWAAEGARRIAIDNINTRLIAAKREEPPKTSAEGKPAVSTAGWAIRALCGSPARGRRLVHRR